MSKVLGGLVAAGFFLILGFGIFLLGAPQMRFVLSSGQSFAPVAAEKVPASAPEWTSSTRQLNGQNQWPTLPEILQNEIASKGGLDFPILVPKGFAENRLTMAASNFRIELLTKGYYVTLRSADMEVMIMGTAITHHAMGETPEGVQPDYVHAFQDPGPRPAGGRITFGAYGADYSVTFDCRVTDPGLRRNCLSGETARALVSALIDGTSTPLTLPDFEGS